MKKILKKIYSLHGLNQSEIYELFNYILFKNIKEIELAGSIIAMKMRGETINEIIGMTHLFLEKAKKFPTPQYNFSDIVGTGGDNNNDINISTVSAFVAASLGLKIAKHCNIGITSTSGSSNLLKKFQINLTQEPKISRLSLDKFNLCFLFAPFYNKGYKNIHHIRHTLSTRTIFNILGPLTNPSRPPFTLIGVYNIKWISIIIKILKKLNYKKAIVLSSNNTDEVSLSGETHVSELYDGKIISYILQPKDFGFQPLDIKKSSGGTPSENYTLIKKLLQGDGNIQHAQIISANVAMVLKIFGYNNLKENAQHALEIIQSGIVYKKILQIKKIGIV
ncbi:anthranilate phosphoribosyltransferase [Buchnera aphidicola (Thelaxes californica)]|uniref:Anthranilate phosphoribosyltransferase n=1 Tax=Buchnera aphidicola (Thelaxes californica) TaxID=1315998 RepID=A0A4D6YJP1_9GAMM|nr:anthranilate phosphoribosyltransferase [Buchnera aphidicola]QCI26751.1 anthranilate phosphoribosyltransferase [Buchnera aphidicola (Thelaxes californica)]